MAYFGERGECPECGRELAIRADLIVYHRDEGEPCSGTGQFPKETGLAYQMHLPMGVDAAASAGGPPAPVRRTRRMESGGYDW